MHIQTSSAVCGAGKTFAISHRSIRQALAGHRVLIVQPTLELLEQTITTIEKHCAEQGVTVRVRAIHGENSTSVVADIVRHMQHPEFGGEIFLITHAAHERLPFVPTQNWHLVYDEVPQVVWCAEMNLTCHHRLLTDGFEVSPSGYPECDLVEAASGGYLARIIKAAEHDDVDAVLSEVASRVTSRHWQVYVDSEQYSNLTENHGNTKRRKLSLFGVMQPSLMEGYRSVTLLSADADESALYLIWSRMNVGFSEDTELNASLRFLTHENGDLITIRYLTKDDWSKRLRDREMEGKKVLRYAADAVLETFGNEEFCYLANNDVPQGIWGQASRRAHRLPNSAHGINTYQRFHNVALLSALNPTSSHFAFLSLLGLDGDAVKNAITRSALYQAACRISIRNPEDRSPKTVIVPDLNTAAWLQGKFPGAVIENLHEEEIKVYRRTNGRPPIHESEAARKLEARRVEMQDRTAELTRLCADEQAHGREIAYALNMDGTIPEEIRCGTETPISNTGFRPADTTSAYPISKAMEQEPSAMRVFATLYADLYSTSASMVLVAADWPACVKALRESWEENTLSKRENFKFVPACMPDHGRSDQDVRWSRMIVLDIDEGDLGHEDFAAMFRDLTMLVVNSASTDASLSRYRVFIPLGLPVPADLYRDLVQRMIKRLNRAGYWSKEQLHRDDRIKSRLKHGVDRAKLMAASLLNVPAQPSDPSGRLFVEFTGGRRKELDVMRWIELGNPRRRDDGAEQVTVETPEDRAREADERRAIFEADWNANIGAMVVPDAVRASIEVQLEEVTLTEGDLNRFWTTTRTQVAELAAVGWHGLQ
ncbi:DEAD/DEAH box helicase family protein [Roseomonas harenae]|uniref:DEAD/DEAH box helicase family protein n=1 Tax=Muricoccus harenae TaxID=2692566 RepID=UPI0013318BC6|nr:DEAD/DEAH box helicase family protein [Roseomonas harenae]